jgi:hypothetical protein
MHKSAKKLVVEVRGNSVHREKLLKWYLLWAQKQVEPFEEGTNNRLKLSMIKGG